jgi:uncharacterized protein YbjT (DUF2867 family)
MILLCGGTGLLGSRIAQRLADRSLGFRALVRPGTDASDLERLGAEIARGDLRDAATLPAAVAGVQTVITTANAISRVLGGKTDLTLHDVDDRGNANLVRAADEAGVERFVFLSFPAAILAASTPFSDAKLATERRLRDSSMHEVIVRPDAYQEVQLSPLAGFDWPNRSVTIFGKGDAPAAYVAVDDVAEAVVRLAIASDPPRLVEFGGPEAMTRNQAADALERSLARLSGAGTCRGRRCAWGLSPSAHSGPRWPRSWVRHCEPISSSQRRVTLHCASWASSRVR